MSVELVVMEVAAEVAAMVVVMIAPTIKQEREVQEVLAVLEEEVGAAEMLGMS